jgi:hypothetical protein
MLDQRYKPPLGVAIAVDVSLRRLNRSMASQKLNVTERTTSLVDDPGCPRNECSPTGMRRASLQASGPVGTVEPDNDAKRRHRLTAF